MENLTLEQLKQVLPVDPKQANDMLLRIVLTLRERLNTSNVELQKTKDQLCAACSQQKYTSQDKDYAAALAKVVSIQADYDALLSHFDTIKDKHRQTLLSLEQNRQENEKLRTRNSDLVQQLQKFQVDLSRFNELQLILTNTQLEKEKLEELQAKTYASQLDAQQRLSKMQFDQDSLVLQLKNTIQEQQVALLHAETAKKENQRLKREIQEIFQITSSQSLQELQQQLSQLKKENSSQKTELEILTAKINEERLTSNAKIELEKKKTAENLLIQSENQLKQQRNQLESGFNQQFLQQQKIIQDLQQNMQQTQKEFQEQKLDLLQQNQQFEQLKQKFDQEKLIFDNAKEKAKKRNALLNEQLNETLQQKDELELRIHSQEEHLKNLEQERDELRLVNKQLLRQSESVFIQLKDLEKEPIKIDQEQINFLEKEIEKVELEDVKVKEQKKLHFIIIQRGGDTKEEFAIVCSFMAEQFQSQYSGIEDGKVLIDQKLQIVVDEQFEEHIKEGLQIGIFDTKGEQTHESGIVLDDILTKGETEGEVDLGGVIIQIQAKIE